MQVGGCELVAWRISSGIAGDVTVSRSVVGESAARGRVLRRSRRGKTVDKRRWWTSSLFAVLVLKRRADGMRESAINLYALISRVPGLNGLNRVTATRRRYRSEMGVSGVRARCSAACRVDRRVCLGVGRRVCRGVESSARVGLRPLRALQRGPG